MNTPKAPFENTKLAKYVAQQVSAIAPAKSRQQIAREVGYEKPHVISMIEKGGMRMPLDKVSDFAKALECDVAHLVRLALEQHLNDETAREVVPRLFENVVTDDEMRVVTAMRMLDEGKRPELPEKQLERIHRLAAEAMPIP